MVQVAGSLNVPSYQWPLKTGIACLALAPISFGLRELGWRGAGRVRGIITILTFIGPIGFLVIGVLGLLFAISVRLARNAVRRDLEDLPGGFALIDRRGRHEFQDSEVESLGFRSRSAARGTVTTQKGWAELWVVGPEGPEKISLDWEYPDGCDDPLGEFLERIKLRLLAHSVKTIDSGGSIEGEGWSLSRPGLQVGDAFDILPFQEIAAVEYHDAQLQVWKAGMVEPYFKVKAGSKNEAILQAILNRRKSNRVVAQPIDSDPGEGLGRILFERRATLSNRIVTWFIVLIIAAVSFAVVSWSIRDGLAVFVVPVALIVVVLVVMVALSGNRSCFRFQERGISKVGLFGTRNIPFDDLSEVKSTLMSYDSLLKLVFKPVSGRGLKPISLMLPATDAALETIQSSIPEDRFSATRSF